MKKGGYGLVYQDVTRNNKVSPAAKGLYAYLASLCGVEDSCYPSVDTITKDMGIGRDTFYRYIRELVAAGVVKKEQTKMDGGKFGRSLYRLTHEVTIIDNSDLPFTDFKDTDYPHAVVKETNNNNTTINNINNNSIYYAQISELYNEICISFPRIIKLSEARKRAINARIRAGYTVSDFRQLFEEAEASDFLKGKNNQNWSANFDWLIKDNNMAKVLDGNYRNKESRKMGEVTNDKEPSNSFRLWE